MLPIRSKIASKIELVKTLYEKQQSSSESCNLLGSTTYALSWPEEQKPFKLRSQGVPLFRKLTQLTCCLLHTNYRKAITITETIYFSPAIELQQQKLQCMSLVHLLRSEWTDDCLIRTVYFCPGDTDSGFSHGKNSIRAWFPYLKLNLLT